MAGVNVGMESMSNRVYPTHSSSRDTETWTQNTGGGRMSKSHTPETYAKVQNNLTMEEVRWSEMRKKIPGMGRVPRTKFYHEEDGFERARQENNFFIRTHFKQKECYRFVPAKKGQLPVVKKVRDMRCECGEVLLHHHGMQGPTPTSQADRVMVESYLVPDELKPYVTVEKGNNDIPNTKDLPSVSWNAETAIRSSATTSFGKISFVNVDAMGGQKPAKYVRLAPEDSIDHLIELMDVHWKINEPKRPNLVISVVGGAKNCKLDGHIREKFSTGLIKAAKTTDAWLITSGFNMGVMKYVGMAVKDGQSFTWNNDRMAHVLRCIGIAPWGYVNHRQVLESPDGQGLYNAEYKTSNIILHGQPVPLNANHTHFIFVDDGLRNRYGGVAAFRAKFENRVQQPREEGGLGIPVVLVVVEGGTDAIDDANNSLQQNIPVVVCAGTGRAADILSYAYQHYTGKLTKEHKLRRKIQEAYGTKWSEEEKEAKTEPILEKIKSCLKKKDLMVNFSMNKNEDLDLAILSCLLKAKSGEATEKERLNQLRLALTWDRVDIAQEDIFREDCIWPPGSLDNILMDAILMERVEFVHLILQQGVVMKEFLTKGRLTQLYQKALSTKKADTVHLKRIAVRHGLQRNDENFSIKTVKMLMEKLMDKYDEKFQDLPLHESQADEKKQCTYPYKEILIWSSLLLKQKMAKFAWEMGGEPVTSAVAVSRIYGSMATYINRNEQAIKDRILKYKDEFEKLAVEVLDECHAKDHEKAMMLVERCSPTWSDMSSLSMAASAFDRAYLASVACQNSISITWKRGIVSPWQRVFVCMIVPFMLMTPYLEMSFMGELGFNLRQKITTFYTAPITKFANHTLMYIAFLVLFTYMLLVDFEAHRVTPIECVCVAWIFTFMVDDIYTLLTFPSPTFYGKLRDWYGFLKWLDLINFILAFIAFIIHFREDYFEVTKIMYCINGVILYIRILKTYTANANLGPKMVMIQRMMAELKMFVMVLLVFLLAYGISSQALLYKQRRPSWSILKDMFYFPYWQLFGEIFLDDLNTDTDCLEAARRINDTALAATEELYCLQNHWLVYFLLAAYLMVGNVLLLNLLIAIFSHVFDTIEENSIEIWKYQMYFLTMEFDNKTAFVPPFSIFAHFYLTFKWIFRKTCCRKGTKGVQFSKRHLEYLQLFEKEEMTNLLRRKKASEKETIETKISLLQKRNEELFKVLEEDFFPELGGVEDHHKHYLETTFFNQQEVAKAPELVKEETKETIVLTEQVEDEETKKKKKKKLKKEKKEKKKKEKEERLELNNFDNPVFKHEITPDKSLQFSPHLDVVSQSQVSHISPVRKSSLESPKRPGLYRRISNRSYCRDIQDIDSSDEDVMRTSGHFGMQKALNVPSGHLSLRRSLSRDSTDSEENNTRAASPRMFTRMARESSTEDERKKHKKKRKKPMKKMISDTD
ncbi:transient receptor potential cation channel subfamily M member 1-like isoform X2 [Mizuhopecten yessoensis]|uniref:transient receptor potential cation channel subfamily M member 1-like isoform X2 n=1 Tax=Mizuhopecten yessoensis TaxID=6573 RepID=UPI000B45EB5A|nr:transient receptor potential cation channel subfamily M member 1-like isoform X2 [Mizuhopecten yessoensis]